MATNAEESTLKLVKRKIRLVGTKEIMFDRYAGDNNTQLAWSQKIYLIPETNILCMPVINIVSFLTAHNTNSAPKRLMDARKYKGVANAILSFTDIAGPSDTPEFIPFLKNGKPIKVGKFGDEVEPLSGLRLHKAVARLEKGIPNPKERPVLPLPWALEFTISIRANKEIKELQIRNLLEEGGFAIGLGTWRGIYGKFVVDMWE